MRFYKKSDYINLIACSIAVFILRLLLVHFFILGPGVKTDSLTQIYFGGLPINFSFDLMSLSLYLAIISIEVIVINENMISGILENFDIIKCRTSNTNRVFHIIIRAFFFHSVFLVASNYLVIVLLEKKIPAYIDSPILFSEFILIITLDIIYLTVRCLLKSKLAYLILLIVFISPVIFTGFLFQQGSDSWTAGKYFILNDYIFNFTHSMDLRYTVYHYTLTTPGFTLFTSSVWSETLCKVSLTILLMLLSKNLFRKYSMF